MQHLDAFAAYQDNFLPFETGAQNHGVRYDRTTTAGLRYRLNYLTPYWDPEGGFLLDAFYEGGIADLPQTVGLQKVYGQFSMVKSLPDFSRYVADVPGLRDTARPVLAWIGEWRLAWRIFGGTSMPARGEFFTMGGGQLFRGFDLAQRQGSTVWVGSVELRVPLAKGLTLDTCDHVCGLRNVYGAVFYDVGNAYTSFGPTPAVAHGVGAGLRLDVTWFGFVERSTIRLDLAKALNGNTGMQLWFGINQPF
jgi:hypothetical protein